MVVIDGKSFNVPVVSLKRTADFLDKYGNRTEDGVLQREHPAHISRAGIIGTGMMWEKGGCILLRFPVYWKQEIVYADCICI